MSTCTAATPAWAITFRVAHHLREGLLASYRSGQAADGMLSSSQLRSLTKAPREPVHHAFAIGDEGDVCACHLEHANHRRPLCHRRRVLRGAAPYWRG